VQQDPQERVARTGKRRHPDQHRSTLTRHRDRPRSDRSSGCPRGAPTPATAHPLPAELKLRTKNKGTEGLTVTPDGRTLAGIVQSAIGVCATVGLSPSRVLVNVTWGTLP